MCEKCLAKGTKIRMADSSEKEIEKISSGDIIMTNTGGRPVANRITGKEKIMYWIMAEDGTSILLSEDCPVRVKHQVELPAQDLTLDMILETPHGDKWISSIAMIPYDNQAFELRLEGEKSCYFCANGFWVKDSLVG